METCVVKTKTIDLLPKLNCGACGYKSCDEFAASVDSATADISRCIHAKELGRADGCIACNSVTSSANSQLHWADSLGREFDFILDMNDGEPGPRETILPYNPALVKELGVKLGDVMIGRPMGMSCGCPITHCGVVTSVDARNGLIEWCITGPLRPRSEGFIDIGYYTAQAYDGIIKDTRTDIKVGMRYWFKPRRCMLQWRHSGLVNSVTKLRDGSLRVRIEGLFIG